MPPLLVHVTLVLLGLACGPTLHHFGVRAGVRRSFDGILPRCETCERVRLPLALRCSEGHAVRRREPWIWAVTGALFLAAGLVTTHSRWLLPSYLLLAGVSVVLYLTDVDHKLIPNRVLYPATVAAFALLAAGAVFEGSTDRLGPAALGAAGYFGILFVVYLIARGGFGFGDVKLAFLLGAMTAFQSQRTVLLAVFFTGVIGGIPAIALLVTRKARFSDELPYGPPMLAGAWVALVFGEAFGRMITG
jgi:leader peptidase (prepilin peptidase) / N-methyltransferase